jgi:DNA polymerase III delta' subunit
MIIGHQKQQEKLKALFTKNSIPHALLFSGPESVGKRYMALWFLKMINCKEKNAPCCKCRSCYEIEEHIHPDIFQVAQEEKEIKIKQIQEVTEKMGYKGVKADFKGVVIDDAHLMNHSAQNSLLKTLEEPNSNTVIILVTSYPYVLLPTILSRVFEIKFYFASNDEIAKAVRSKEIADLSLGRPGKAIQYLNFPKQLEEVRKTKKDIEEMLEKDLSLRISKIKKIVDDERGEEFLQNLLQTLKEKLISGIEEKKDMKKYINVLKETEEAIFLSTKTNVNMRLILEKIIIKI